MDCYEEEVRALEFARGTATAGDRPVAFYGSSSIRLWETLDDDFSAVPVINLGFGGSTLAACAHYFHRLLPPVGPRSWLLYAGDNDLGDGRSPHDVLGSLRDLLGQADALLGPIPLAFVSIKPSPARSYLDGHIRSANELARRELEGRPSAHFVDIYPRMLGPDGRPRPELYAEDGLHLSREGYRLWADEVRAISPNLF